MHDKIFCQRRQHLGIQMQYAIRELNLGDQIILFISQVRKLGPNYSQKTSPRRLGEPISHCRFYMNPEVERKQTTSFSNPRQTHSGVLLPSLFKYEALQRGCIRQRLGCLYQAIDWLLLKPELHGTVRVAVPGSFVAPTHYRKPGAPQYHYGRHLRLRSLC